MKRTCSWCQREFEANSHSGVCCSRTCARAYGRHGGTLAEFAVRNGATLISPGLYRKTCQWCGKAFATANIQKRNCCPTCGKYLARSGGLSKADWQASVAARKSAQFGGVKSESGTYRKICPICGQAFEAEHIEQVYCGESCKAVAKRRRQTERQTGRPSEKTIVCKVCGTAFTALDRRRSRCPDCAEQAKRLKAEQAKRRGEPRTLTCAWCGRTFQTKASRGACCCTACATRYRKYGCSRAEYAVRHPTRFAYLNGERERTCAWCGRPFTARHLKQAYCSEACQKDAGHHRDCADLGAFLLRHRLDEGTARGRGHYLRTCQWCGETFEATNILQRNCCPTCGKYLARCGGLSRVEWKADVERRKRKTCLWCGREFRGQTTKAMYCSDNCNALYHAHGCVSREEARVRRLFVCEWCGKPFVGDREGVRFCCSHHAALFRQWQVGVEHRALAVRRHYEVRHCSCCGHVFVADDSRTGRLCPVCEAAGLAVPLRKPFAEFVESETAVLDMLVADRRRHDLRQAQYDLLFGETRCAICGAFVRRPRPGAGLQLCPSCYDASPDDAKAVFDRPVAEQALAYARSAIPKVKPLAHRAWYARNRETAAAARRAWYAAHAEELRQQRHDRYWSDLEWSRARNRFYYHRRTYGFAWQADREVLIRGNLYARVMRMRGIMSAAPDSPEVLKVYASWRASYLASRRLFRTYAAGRGLAALSAEGISSFVDFVRGGVQIRRTLQAAQSKATREAERQAREAAVARLREERLRLRGLKREEAEKARQERLALADQLRRERAAARQAEEERRALARAMREARRLEREAERQAAAEAVRLRREARIAARQARLEELRRKREAREAEREARRQWIATHPDEIRSLRLQQARAAYWLHRDERLRQQRIRRLEHRDEILAEHRRRYWAARGVDIEAKMAQERAEMAARDAEIFAARQKFAHVERVLRLPPEERWAFAKDWSPEERAYAAQAAAKSYGHALEMFDHQDDVLSIGDLDG